MEKKSGVSEGTRSLPSGSGAVRTIGGTFQPNLAMGGGSYRIPIDLPSGPGTFSPRLELVYDTAIGNSVFGLGWMHSIPYVERKRSNVFAPVGEEEFSVGGETLVPRADGSFVPFIQETLQTWRRSGDHWTSAAPSLVTMRYGSSDASRIAGMVNGAPVVHRWLLDRITFPGGRHVDVDYEADGVQRYLRRLKWSVFRVEFVQETRPDPYSRHDAGFELRTTRRCRRIELHHDRLTPTLIRTIDFTYTAADFTGVSLLSEIQVTGWRGTTAATMPRIRLAYTRFDPAARRIEKFTSRTQQPPALDAETTLLDFRGTALPGILRLDDRGGTYWPNVGNHRWGAPQRLGNVPAVSLADDGVRFADVTGSGTADLVVAGASGTGFYANDPELGFRPRREIAPAPTFSVADPDVRLLDLDGDGVSDLLSLRTRRPLAFFHRHGEWRDPVSLPPAAIPDVDFADVRLRFADMNGDGNVDLVLLKSGMIVWWPSLGDGRWGERRVMADTPLFDVPRPDDDVYLADVNGDGASDLILVGNGRVRVFINRGGEGFSAPIVLDRTPLISNGHFLLADMTGSGTAGLLWTRAGGTTHGYWYLDLLNGVKPQLLSTIDNGAGLVTSLEYSTSTRERVRDLDAGVAWSGYLPFTVSVVKRLTHHDRVRGRTRTVVYDYHDGHFDGRAREYLGFARVDSLQLATEGVAAVSRRYYYHTRGASARDAAFLAGKGQPHRTELVDPATGEVRQVEESTWTAISVPTVSADRPAWLAAETARTSRRVDGGVEYASERVDYDVDSVGNVRRERRRAEWRDVDGTLRKDEQSIDTIYAMHATMGVTNIPSRVRRVAGGRLLKEFRYFYDGTPFDGLPLGEVANGFRVRQTEVVLTKGEIDDAYGAAAPALLSTLYRTEVDPDFGSLFVKDVARARVDAFGNQLETLDALGHRLTLEYDADSLHPIAITESDVARRELRFDPIAQQIARNVDRNGNVEQFRYDGLGNVIEVDRRGALAGKPTETYEYRRDLVPNRITRRVRMEHGDAAPGNVKVEYRDGADNVVQVKMLDASGRWAVGKQELLAVGEVLVGERDAWFSSTSDFEPSPPSGVAERRMTRDFANRVVEEVLFNGARTLHRYEGNAVHFYGPEAAARLATDPATKPTRSSWSDAHDNLVAVAEYDASRRYLQRRRYDALNRLVAMIDAEGNDALEYVFDLWGNRLRITSLEAGPMTFVYDAGNNEVLRTDADGRTLHRRYDRRGRAVELRRDGPAGPVEETYVFDTGAGANLGGRLARVEGAFGTVDYSYSVEGDPVEIRRTFTGSATTYTIRFGYNAQRKVTSVEYPDGAKVTYRYAAVGTLAEIPGYIKAVEHGPTGRRTRMVYANGLETRRGYTPGDGLLDEVITEVTATGVKYQHLLYELEDTGMARAIEDRSTVTGKARNNQTFRYDSRNRLAQATSSLGGGRTWEYRHDALGNLVFSTESFNEEMEHGLQLRQPRPNQLIKRKVAASAEYTYDKSGLLTSDPAVGKLTYDHRHRLVRVDKPDGTRVDIAYDHNDRRVITTVTDMMGSRVRYEVEGVYFDGVEKAKIVFDEDKRLAVIPAAGDTLLHHLDRLGNVNVVSNLTTGAFVGHDEYTPYGRLLVSIVISPAFTFMGARFTDGLDIVLLGARHYRPALGRFLTPDHYLMLNPDKIPALLSATNLYLYAYANPANFSDPTGQLAPLLVAIIVAAIVGAVAGLIGAAANGAETWDEWILWILGGAVGAVLVVLLFYGIGFAAGGAALGLAMAKVSLIVWATASYLGSMLTRILDATDSTAAWFFSWILKSVQSPFFSLIGAFGAGIAAAAGKRVDFRRGTLFIEAGSGTGAITFGAVVYTQSGQFNAMGQVNDDLARHEAFHTREVVALGEWGFYVTYITVGGIWGSAEARAGEGWTALNAAGCGNPFEKTAHTYYSRFLLGPGMGTTGSHSCG